MAERPTIYSFIDRSASNVDPAYDESPLNTTGFGPNDVIPSKYHNTLWLLGSLWQVYLDYNTAHTQDLYDATSPQQWSQFPLSYTLGEEVLVMGASVDQIGVYCLNGLRVEVNTTLLKSAGALPLLQPFATVPGRIWIYVDMSVIVLPTQPIPVIRVESVGPAVAETPGPGEYALVGVDIDGAGVVTGNSYPASPPATEIIYNNFTLQRWLGKTRFEDVATFLANVIVDQDLTVKGSTLLGDGVADTVTASGFVTVNGFSNPGETYLGAPGFDVFVSSNVLISEDLSASKNVSLCTGVGNFVCVIGSAALDTLTVSATTTFNAPVTVANGQAVTLNDSVNLGTGAGNKTVTIGADSLDSLTCNATSTFNSNIGFGANTITGAGGTITTGTVNADVVAPTEVRYDTIPGALPTTNGRSSYNGRKLTLGDGSTARRFHTPLEDYTVSDTTVLAIEDITGAAITMDIDDNEWIKVRLNAAHLLAGNDTFNVLIAASNGVDSIVVLNGGDDDAASYGFTFGAAQKIMQTLAVRWKPTNDVVAPANTTWTLQVRHGVSGGNLLTTSNVQLEAWYE